MGIRERREREKQGLRQNILAAALEIAAHEGWQAVTMRKVAELIEYSPPTIYEYFDSKDAILQGLVHEGFSKMVAQMRTALTTADPQERLVQLGCAYTLFAWDNPELYQVMHNLAGAACHHAGPPPELREIGGIMHDSLLAAFPHYQGHTAALEAALDIHRATMHGLVALMLDNRLPGGRERLAALVEQASRGWLLNLQQSAPS